MSAKLVYTCDFCGAQASDTKGWLRMDLSWNSPGGDYRNRQEAVHHMCYGCWEGTIDRKSTSFIKRIIGRLKG